MSLPSRERELKHQHHKFINDLPKVAPFAGARVETIINNQRSQSNCVAPFAGARVETLNYQYEYVSSLVVAPFAGARVETYRIWLLFKTNAVAPFAGARVETRLPIPITRLGCWSLPSRERELKQPGQFRRYFTNWVAPFAGARVETP